METCVKNNTIEYLLRGIKYVFFWSSAPYK